jgi:hypothetical protein
MTLPIRAAQLGAEKLMTQPIIFNHKPCILYDLFITIYCSAGGGG